MGHLESPVQLQMHVFGRTQTQRKTTVGLQPERPSSCEVEVRNTPTRCSLQYLGYTILMEMLLWKTDSVPTYKQWQHLVIFLCNRPGHMVAV